jgi:hypothetical protein
MGSWIDGMARVLASGLSRREALRRLAGGAAGVAVALSLGDEAEAKKKDPETKACRRLCATAGGKKAKKKCVKACRKSACSSDACAGGTQLCGSSPTCACIATTEGVPVCLEVAVVSCTNRPPCTSSGDCAAGQVCAGAGCCEGQGICLPRCSSGTFTPAGEIEAGTARSLLR